MYAQAQSAGAGAGAQGFQQETQEQAGKKDKGEGAVEADYEVVDDKK
jgi:hypothetical protein